jgi:cytochrome b6-f complex iron-sulfur subunit
MGAVLDFFKALAGICQTKPLDQALWRIDGDQAIVLLAGASQLAQPGSAARLEGEGLGAPVLVLRGADGGYRAFVNRCTHGGRRLDPAQGGQTLRCCSVNHSTFDLKGAKLSGPAKGPLTALAVHHEKGELFITLPAD